MYVCGRVVLLCLALTLVPFSTTATTCNSQRIYYVHLTLRTACLRQPCLTLSVIIANPDRYITSNTVFKLFPGRHKLTGQFVASDVECITIKPYTFIGVVQVINSGSSSSSFQFNNSVHVSMAGIEMDDIDISLIGTRNVTLNRLVIDGPRTAISLRNTVDTKISDCVVKNTGWIGVTLRDTIGTNISYTSLNNTGWNGFDLYNATDTNILYSSVNRTGWNGIELFDSNLTLISHTLVNNTGWDGIKVDRANQTTVIDTTVNNTGWSGAEISYTEQTAIFRSVFANNRWSGIEVDRANRTSIHIVKVSNIGWSGIEICRVRLTSIFWVTVQGAGYRCFHQCQPIDPTLQVQCLP